ncbi:hypothetical protein [Streptomyces sp. ST1015]|uniref:hypothetical protein n=1 Tax=Streptomyces sp. ST1015 TaxID=1848900 RepID=UPI00223B42FE|nr:hypothetical protein [Streptomyces sp. ST1015]
MTGTPFRVASCRPTPERYSRARVVRPGAWKARAKSGRGWSRVRAGCSIQRAPPQSEGLSRPVSQVAGALQPVAEPSVPQVRTCQTTSCRESGGGPPQGMSCWAAERTVPESHR